jgi:ubiquinone/menaquinone biosynthesis C-methylase UbiE
MAGAADEIFDDYAFARLYDTFNPWGAGDDFYLALARQSGGPVLDLGCGTGMLACRIAAEVSPVTGVDLAAGMLQVARSRPGADRVTWIEGDGRNLQLQQRFNLIYLTGHAFQVFLTDADVLSVLRTAARQLNPEGRLAFETRNPGARAWLSWNPKESRKVAQLPGLGRVEEFSENVYDSTTGIAELTHHYRFLDKGGQQVGHSRLRFIDRNHLAELIASAGLSPREWYGSWDRSDYSPASREIIVVAGLT